LNRPGADSSIAAMHACDALRRIRDELGQLFLERSAVIDGALTAILCGQHVLIIGPPGTAKSMLAEEVCSRFEGAAYFQWLLTRFTTPEELFGAVSLAGLERDEYRRVTTNKLPEAHIAFLDEVFKASSSILNTILTLVNERRFHNGREVGPVPLITLFGASNELPEDDELQALYDRFLLRFVVGFIEEDFRFLKMLQSRPSTERTKMSLATLESARREAAVLPVPNSIYGVLAELRRELGRSQLVSSDRRYRQSIDLLRAHAYLEGRSAVTEEDLFFLEHVLWRDPSEHEEVRATIHRLLRGYLDEAKALLYQSRELREYAQRQWENNEIRSRAVVEAHTKIRNILARVGSILDGAREAGRPVDAVEAVQSEIVTIQREMLEAL
jgi:MoxR-like ATPase